MKSTVHYDEQDGHHVNISCGTGYVQFVVRLWPDGWAITRRHVESYFLGEEPLVWKF